MQKIAYIILNLTQPLAVIVFILAGLSAIYLNRIHQGLMNLCVALANFMIFYGGKFFK